MRFHYVRADDVHKTIGYDTVAQKTTSDPVTPRSFTVSPALLDMTNPDSCRDFVNCTRLLGAPLFDLPPNGRRCLSRRYKEEQNDGYAVTRTKDDFAFQPGPGLMFVDCDMKDPKSHFRPLDELGVPADVMRLEYFSSSSFLHRHGQWVTQASGRHIMLAVENAADIPQLGEWLYLRSWLVGNGYIHITPNGRALDRSYVDQAVWQPERFVFGRPVLKDGLGQALYEPLVSGVRPLTSADLMLPYEAEQEARRLILVAKHEAVNSPEAQQKFTAFAQQHRFVGESIEDAIVRNNQMGRLGLLPPYMVLQTVYGPFTVRDIYANFDRFYETAMADPVEPHYGNHDTRIAMFVRPGGRPALFSQAHGGNTWLLMPAAVDAYDPTVNVNDNYLDIDDMLRM